MTKLAGRIVTLFLVSACLTCAYASDAESSPSAAKLVADFFRLNQSEEVTALTDDELQKILDRLERERADALDAAVMRRGGQGDPDYRGAFNLRLSPEPEIPSRGVSMDFDTDEHEVMLEWFVGF